MPVAKCSMETSELGKNTPDSVTRPWFSEMSDRNVKIQES